MKTFIIETKDDKVLVEAVDRDHAYAKYFYDIIKGKIALDKVGSIVMLKDGEDEYPFRTVPLLWKMGILSTRYAIDNIVACVGVTRKEAKDMLKEAGDHDAAKLVPLIDDLKLEEEKE